MVAGVTGLLRTSLHDAHTGETLVNFEHPSGAAEAVISPDGRILATAGNDGLVRLMAANLLDLVALANSRLTRSLTTGECQQYMHIEDCPDR